MNIDEIRAVTDKATSGPWKLLTRGNTVKSLAIEGVCGGMKFIDRSDAAFIASARSWVPTLCDEVEADRKKIAELEKKPP